MEGSQPASAIVQTTCMQEYRQNRRHLTVRRLSSLGWATPRVILQQKLKQREQHSQFVTCKQISHQPLHPRIRL